MACLLFERGTGRSAIHGDGSHVYPEEHITVAPPLISLERVNKHFGTVHVLRDINLTVSSGEVVVVVGPSGGGKSTLCRTINRLETIDRGIIRFDARPLPEEGSALARLRSEVGMFGSRVSSAIVVAVIYIGLSMALSVLAHRLEQRRRSTAIAE